MDFGFVRGKATVATEKGTFITSKEGYKCYLLIADEFSQHLWVFLFTNNNSPEDTVTSFFDTHGIKKKPPASSNRLKW